MTKDELLDLADRCEREEASWDLSVAIELAIVAGTRRFTGKGPFCVETADQRRYNPPAYASSLDAAVTLVPEGASWNVQMYRGSGDAMVVYEDNEDRPDLDAEASAATPALALCAAALRARAATMP